MNNGILGGMFDFNGDGHLDPSEQAVEFMFLDSMMKKETDDGKEDNIFDNEE